MRMTDLYAFGARTEIGTYTFDEENIVRFARRFDPQPFHIDPEAARRSLFGGLCASGWHTCAVWMRSFVDYWSTETARLKSKGLEPPTLGPSPGFQKLQWLKPVYAGDTVTYSVTLLASRALASRPGWILNSILCEGENQHGVLVLRFESTVLEFE
jgi:acyl dehydratase